MEVRELNDAIGRGDVARLTKVHGIGKKTAERLVVELREKVKLVQLQAEAEGTAAPAFDVRGDLVSALVNLGYKSAQAEKAADVASLRAGTEAPFELLFREALKGLRSGA
jgi:Holliday junction DNA helicase RuvA